MENDKSSGSTVPPGSESALRGERLSETFRRMLDVLNRDKTSLQRRVLDLLGMLQAVESQLCAEWLMYDGSRKHLQPLIEQVSKTIIEAQGTSLWPNAQTLAAKETAKKTADERTTREESWTQPEFKPKESK